MLMEILISGRVSKMQLIIKTLTHDFTLISDCQAIIMVFNWSHTESNAYRY